MFSFFALILYNIPFAEYGFAEVALAILWTTGAFLFIGRNLISLFTNKPSLTIDYEGIKYRGYFKDKTHKWSDIGIVSYWSSEGEKYLIANTDITHRTMLHGDIPYDFGLHNAEIQIPVKEFSFSKNREALQEFSDEFYDLLIKLGRSEKLQPPNLEQSAKEVYKKNKRAHLVFQLFFVVLFGFLAFAALKLLEII